MLLLQLKPLLLLCRSGFSCRSSISTSCSSGSSSSRSSTNTGPDSGDQGLQVTRLQGLGEQSWPVRFNINIGSLQDGGDLLWGDSHVVISKDEGSTAPDKFRSHDDD